MDSWIEIYRNGNTLIHRKLNTILIQSGSKLSMKVYNSENEAIFASLSMLIFLEDNQMERFVDE